MTEQTQTDPRDYEVTPARAQLLADHARFVQGGYSTPEIEAERARKDMSDGGAPIDWARFQSELDQALEARGGDVTEEPKVAFDIEKMRKYKQLREMQGRSDAEMKAFKEEADKIEIDLIEMFGEAGVQNFNIDGKTIYLHRSIYAQRLPDVTPEDVQAALIESGAGELVKPSVNAQSLNAYVRELTEDDDAEGLPEALKAVLEAGERFSVRIIAGGTKAKSKTHSK